MDFKNLKFSLDTGKIKKSTSVVRCWSVLSPTYLEETYPLNVWSPTYVFSIHIGATNDVGKKDDCGCGSCHDTTHETVAKSRRHDNYKGKSRSDYLKEMQNIAIGNGGKCHAKEYVSGKVKMLFECKEGHKFKASPKCINNGTWCPVCAKLKKSLTIGELQSIANCKEGKCLSTIYINSKTKLEFECKEMHRWWETPSEIKYNNSWCPYCEKINRLKSHLEELQHIAISNGGVCVAEKYTDAHTKIEFECGNGHRWLSLPTAIKSGRWCPLCAKNKKVTIEDMQRIAVSKGWKCISTAYVNTSTKIELECENGHRLWMTPDGIKAGNGCLYCNRLTIYDFHKIAAGNGGRCLSTEYVGYKIKLLFECINGHQWWARPNGIRNGKWCRKCHNEGRGYILTIDDFHKIANDREGKCISEEYLGIYVKLKFACRKGHIFDVLPNNVRNSNHWCPTCAVDEQKGTIEEMRSIAQERRGDCISAVYVNSQTKLQWRCECGYEWDAVPNSVKMGCWCPRCAKHEKGSIEKMHLIALSNDGKYLSPTYTSAHTKELWECKMGHTFWAIPGQIAFGQWCPYCKNHSEGRCRTIIEILTGKKFHKDRGAVGMELDGYCEELKLAFEHQGQQHYQYVSIFHRGDQTLEKQQERDAKKRLLCAENNITLIEIPFTESTNKKRLYKFIHNALSSLSIPMVSDDKILLTPWW